MSDRRARGSPLERPPARTDSGYFTDAAELRPPAGAALPLAEVMRGLFQADVAGTDPGAVARALDQAPPGERARLVFALADALRDRALVAWVEAHPPRRRRAEQIALAVAPPDPSPAHNGPAERALGEFRAWGDYPFQLIIVPGYTPLDKRTPEPGVHAIARRRLERAVADVRAKKAPFLLVSGGNVHPRGTPYHEALEMKKHLIAMGFPEDRILVEARARHSTTNLRNAGRLMLSRGIPRALITTMGGGVLGTTLFDQDFYFSHPTLSTFHGRCQRELGYRVGELSNRGPGHTEFAPAEDVFNVNYRDPLDP